MSEKEDFEAILTPAQQDRLVDTIETDLLIKPPLGRKFTKAAHLVLTNWANSHKSESRKEITAGLGYAGGSQLGRAVRRVNNVNRIFAGLDAGLDLAEPDYEYLQAVVLSMSQYNRMFLYAHYLKRPAVVAMLYRKMGQGDDEPKKAYTDRVMAEYYKRVGLTKPTYDRYLKDARYEFMVRGGLQL